MSPNVTRAIAGLSSLLFATTAIAQSSSSIIHVNENGEVVLDENYELAELPPLEPAPFAQRTLSYNDGLAELQANSLSVEIARQALNDAAIVESQVRSIFVPTVNAQAYVQYNSREINFAGGNMYAPLGPYLNSVYNNDPNLAQFFLDNPDIPDARDLAAAEMEPTTIQYHWTWGGSLTVTQPLFTAQVFPGRRLAQLVRKQAEAGIEMTLQASMQAYNQLYHQAVATRQYIAIAKRAVDNAKLSSERARILFEANAGSEFDLIRADVMRRGTERDLANAQVSYQSLIEALATLIRVNPDFDVVPANDIDVPAELDVILETALNERAELRLSDLRFEQQGEILQEARLRNLPTLAAQGKVNLARATALSGDILNWSVALFANWDIYDGGKASRDRRTARINQERARLDRLQTEESIRNEIRTSWISYQNQQTIVEQARVEMALAAKAFDITITSRDLGAATQLDVDNALVTLYQAQLALANAEAQRIAAVYNLYILQGTSPLVLER